MGDKLVSIIVPVYNVEPFLEKCLTGIASQTYSNLEVVLVDDGSTDRSGEICNSFSKKDSRFITIHKSNGGVSSARNRGLENIHGWCVAFIDSDDIIDERYIELMIAGMIKYEVNFVRARFKRNGIPQYNFFPYDDKTEASSVVELISFKNLELLAYAGGILVRTSCIGNMRFDEKIFFGEDKLFLTSCFFNSKNSKVLFVKTAFYNYTYNENSASNAVFNEKWLTVKTAADEIVCLMEAYPEFLFLALHNKKIFYMKLYRKLMLSNKKKKYTELICILRKNLLDLRKLGFTNPDLNAEIGELSYLYGGYRIVLFLRRVKRFFFPKNCIGYSVRE